MAEIESKTGADTLANAPLISNVAGSPFMFGGIPNIYFNGFNLSLTNADANMVLLLDGQPQAKVSMSFTTTKTLMHYLSEMMGKLEGATGRPIMKTDEIEAGLKKIQAEEK